MFNSTKVRDPPHVQLSAQGPSGCIRFFFLPFLVHPVPEQTKHFRRKVIVYIRQGDVADLDVLVGPLVEQLDAANLGNNVLGQDLVRGGLNLDLSALGRHIGQQRTVSRLGRLWVLSG